MEFLERKPSKDQLDEYMEDLTEQNQGEFKNLVLFTYYGLEQLAKAEKLHKVGDLFISPLTLYATLGSLITSALLNNLLFNFGATGFIGMFAILDTVALMFVIHLQKKPLYVGTDKLWMITIKQYLHWLARDSEDFIQTLHDFTQQFPEKKSDRFMKLIFKKIVE